MRSFLYAIVAALAAGCGCPEMHEAAAPAAPDAPEGEGLLDITVADWATIEPSGSHAWALSMKLVAFGRADAMTPMDSASPTVAGPRLVLRRGGVDEWFEPSARGVEQGFTVHQPPSGHGELRLEVGISGLSPVLAGDEVLLRDERGRVRASYTDMHAHDAQGRELPCRLAVTGGRIALLVDDAGAAYPLIVDPRWSNAR